MSITFGDLWWKTGEKCGTMDYSIRNLIQGDRHEGKKTPDPQTNE